MYFIIYLKSLLIDNISKANQYLPTHQKYHNYIVRKAPLLDKCVAKA